MRRPGCKWLLMTAAAGCKLSMGSANTEPGPAGHPAAAAAAGRARSGAERRSGAARSGGAAAQRGAPAGAEPGAVGGGGSAAAAAADGAGQRLPSRPGKSFPDPVSLLRAGGGPTGERPGGARPPPPPPRPFSTPALGPGVRGRARRGPSALTMAVFSRPGNLPSVSSQSYLVPHDLLFQLLE